MDRKKEDPLTRVAANRWGARSDDDDDDYYYKATDVYASNHHEDLEGGQHEGEEEVEDGIHQATEGDFDESEKEEDFDDDPLQDFDDHSEALEEEDSFDSGDAREEAIRQGFLGAFVEYIKGDLWARLLAIVGPCILALWKLFVTCFKKIAGQNDNDTDMPGTQDAVEEIADNIVQPWGNGGCGGGGGAGAPAGPPPGVAEMATAASNSAASGAASGAAAASTAATAAASSATGLAGMASAGACLS